jgi:hypothetical protein
MPPEEPRPARFNGLDFGSRDLAGRDRPGGCALFTWADFPSLADGAPDDALSAAVARTTGGETVPA